MNKFFLSLCLVCAVAFQAAGATVISLKSARSVTAEITESSDKRTVRVTVHFIPVTSLDPVNNERMNGVISRFFAEQALSQFYGKEKSVKFSGLKPEIGNGKKQRKTFSYVIPYSAISDAVVKTAPLEKRICAGYSRDTDEDLFLSASEIFDRDLRLAESFFQKEIQSAKNRGETVRNINKAFSALKKNIEKQDDLLSAEKEEFTSKIEKVRRYLLKKNQDASARAADDGASTENLSSIISKYTFRADFKEILVSDKVLLESGGCRAFRLPDGRIALIGIGIAEVNNGSARDRLLRRKIAEQRAFAALAEHERVNVTSNSKLSEATTITAVDRSESGRDQRTITSASSVRAAAFFANMETVGQWYSPDGKLFYLAKGAIISADRAK